MLEKEQKLLEILKSAFQVEGKVIRNRRVEIWDHKEMVPAILLMVKTQLGYKHLNHITCIDWLEEGKFQLVYTVFSHTDKLTLFVKTKIDRDPAIMPNIDDIWDQANTYERELREMYGIEFPGLVGDQEFILEDWDEMPPMRRDFKTDVYAEKTFFAQPGREDAQDVRETITKRSGEEIPEFAKKYSRD
ncbi:MAG: NADH-quinone oxidoreductase subunit C [Bacteroidales bacterium]|nr:NADH-quinone oxidoreductase subunit C [Bacteroidales bacterium]